MKLICQTETDFSIQHVLLDALVMFLNGWSFESSQMKNSGEKLKSLVGESLNLFFFLFSLCCYFDRLQNSHLLTCVMRQQTTRDVNERFSEKKIWLVFWKMMMKMVQIQHAKSQHHQVERIFFEIAWKNLSSISTRITFLKLVAAFTVRASEIERKLTCRWLSSVQQWENKLFPLLIYVSSTMAIDSFPSLIFTLNTHQFRSSYFHRINNS